MDNFDNHLPKRLLFSLKSNHPIVFIEWKQKTLFFSCSYSFYYTNGVEKGKPEFEDWRIFWNKINKLDVWNWKSSYCSKCDNCLDGLNWHLELEYQDNFISCCGKNCFPPANSNRQSKIFVNLIEAFLELGTSIIDKKPEEDEAFKSNKKIGIDKEYEEDKIYKVEYNK